MNQQELKDWIKEINNKLDNHLLHTAVDITKIQNDVKWIKKFFWLVVGASLTSMIGVILGLIFK